MKQQREREQGQAIVILALMMIGLLAFTALAIDGGNAYVERRRSQNGADAGALAGARELWIQQAQSHSSETPIVIAMNTTASQNGITLDADPSDPNQTNVTAYYCLDSECTSLSPNKVGGTGSIPSKAYGIQVVAARQFNAFIGGIIGRGQVDANAQATAIIKAPPFCNDYAIYAGGPGGNPSTVKLTGSNGHDQPNMQLIDGGVYAGGDAMFQNVDVFGNPPFDITGSCSGGCSINGVTPNYGAPPQTMPELYDIIDYQPGGQYAIASGWFPGCSAPNGCGNYHYYSGGTSPSGSTFNGLYYVDGSDINLHDASGTASFVTDGSIQLNGRIELTTFNENYPLFFTTSPADSVGAVKSSNPSLDLHGFIYAPNGKVKISGADGQLSGAIYAKYVDWDASKASILYEPAFCPAKRATVILFR